MNLAPRFDSIKEEPDSDPIDQPDPIDQWLDDGWDGGLFIDESEDVEDPADYY